MGNQQETLTEAEIAWLAGIIEGEGSISMNVRRKNWKGWNGVGVDLSIQVVNGDAGIINKCVDIISKIGYEPHIFERNTVPIHKKDGTVYENKNKTILSIGISKMVAILAVLKLIMPYMAGDKKHRASLIVRFIERRLNYKGKQTKDGSSWYTAYDWDLVKQFYEITGGKLLPEVEGFLNDHTRSAQGVA